MRLLIKIISVGLVVSLLLPGTVFAGDYYFEVVCGINTSTPNSTIYDDAYILGASNLSVDIVSATVKFSILDGDVVKVYWCDENTTDQQMSVIGVTTVNSSPATLTPPAGTRAAKLCIETGSEEGERWAWWSQYTNANGDTMHYADPEISGGGGGGEYNIDFTPVIEKLEEINSNLNSLQSNYLSPIAGDMAAIKEKATVITSQLDNIQTTYLQPIKEDISAIKSNTATIIDQLDTLNNQVQDIRSYLKTPREADINVPTLNNVTFDPTPPDISEPYMQPYRYGRNIEYDISSDPGPGPLPVSPDPAIMEHDEPLQLNEPREVQQPLERQQVTVQEPIQRTGAQQQEPLQQTGLLRQEPLQQSTITRQDPLTPQTPITRQDPVTPQTPVIRQDPLTPQPPLQPQPPL